jgi:hypothetical protein
MTDTEQTFRLLAPDGQEIMNGPMSMIMERLPDTSARKTALDEAVHAAVEAAEAEERRDEARASVAQIITDTITRLCARLDAEEARREEQRKLDEEEAEREAQQSIEDELAALPDPDDPLAYASPLGKQPAPDPMGVGDDGDLEMKKAQDPEKYGVEEDADADAVPLSYGKVPESYVKGEEAQDPVGIGGATDPEPDLEALGKAKDPKQTQQPISSSVW